MLDEHLGYVSDPARMSAYREALKRATPPGGRVLDLACGTGVLGLLALEAGAGSVVAIDDGPVLDLARETFRRAGLLDRVTLIQAHSSDTRVEAPCDVLVCDQVGHFGFEAGLLDAVDDARRRFLRPGGTIVPRTLRLFAAAVEAPEAYAGVADWDRESVPEALRWIRNAAADTKRRHALVAGNLLSPPRELASLDLRQDAPAFLSFDASLEAQRAGTLHGIAGWFECELVEGVWMSNSPVAERPIRRPQAFLPIAEPVSVAKGDRVSVRVMARPADEVLAWTVDVPAHGRRFSHSTWPATLRSKERLEQASAGHTPRLSEMGRARRRVLDWCDGSRTAADIERDLAAAFPDAFPTPEARSRWLARVLRKDTE